MLSPAREACVQIETAARVVAESCRLAEARVKLQAERATELARVFQEDEYTDWSRERSAK